MSPFDEIVSLFHIILTDTYYITTMLDRYTVVSLLTGKGLFYMKIVIINGSPRINGFTATILHEIERNLINKDVSVEYFNLSELSIQQCRGCCSCFALGKCIIDDYGDKLSNIIANSDGLVLGTPTYASNVSGYMKTLIDRGHFVIEHLLKNKQCITVVTGENYGKNDASKILNKLVLFSGGYLSSKIAINALFEIRPVLSIKHKKICKNASIKLHDSINKNKEPLLQQLLHFFVFNFGIKPFVLRKGSKYAGVIRKWKELNII